MRVRAPQIERQLVSVFGAWGMSDPHAETTAQAMVETDLRGVDSHGISMLPTYDQEFRQGRLNMRPLFKTVREAPAMALIDADASLGHPVSTYAMNLAVDKCLVTGVTVVSVFNSHHFGARRSDGATPGRGEPRRRAVRPRLTWGTIRARGFNRDSSPLQSREIES
jgi:LDH2 family malate/lactate/ureidoglycolate dehydrogenase